MAAPAAAATAANVNEGEEYEQRQVGGANTNGGRGAQTKVDG